MALLGNGGTGEAGLGGVPLGTVSCPWPLALCLVAVRSEALSSFPQVPALGPANCGLRPET